MTYQEGYTQPAITINNELQQLIDNAITINAKLRMQEDRDDSDECRAELQDLLNNLVPILAPVLRDILATGAVTIWAKHRQMLDEIGQYTELRCEPRSVYTDEEEGFILINAECNGGLRPSETTPQPFPFPATSSSNEVN